MAFKAVTDLNADTTVSLGGVNRKTGKTNPKTVEGYYLGKRTVEDRKAKSGQSFIYILQTPKGNLGVWGKTDMNRKMDQVTPGAMIRISHTGMVATPNGEMYKYSVEQDLDNTIEVQATAFGNTSDDDTNYSSDIRTADSDEDSDNTDGYNTAEEEEEEEVHPAPKVAAKPSTRIQELLAKKTK